MPGTLPLRRQLLEDDRLLIESFEGREAIYIEKGALRVRVSRVKVDLTEQMMTAQVDEICTPGLGFVMAHTRAFDEKLPRRWQIGASALAGASFSERRWSGGIHVGWSLFFDPEVIAGVVQLAASFPTDLHPSLCYRRVLKVLYPDW